MNLNTKYIHAYRIENHLKTSLVIDTVEAALKKNSHLRGAILHSDRGCQYTSKVYAEKLKEYDMPISMSEPVPYFRVFLARKPSRNNKKPAKRP